MTFKPVNSDLEEISRQIVLKTDELETAREKHLRAQAEHENEFSRYLLQTKIENPEMTQSEIKAKATNLTYNLSLESIKAKSAYMRLQNEIKALRDRMECLQEISYNLRKEATL